MISLSFSLRSFNKSKTKLRNKPLAQEIEFVGLQLSNSSPQNCPKECT